MIKEEQAKFIFATDTLLTGTWTVVDPILVATPLAAVVAVAVSYMTKPTSTEHLKKCYGK
jgi:SSS family solute:Na+ symporter